MAREQRRLAAIVAADVAGYSRLMGQDESGTLATLKALRRDVVDPPIAAHGGRIVKTTGDGLLLEFSSVVARYDDALADLRQACELNPNDAYALNALAYGEVMNGDGPAAKEHLLQCLRLSPRDPWRFNACVVLGNACFLTEEYAEGLKWIAESRREHPNFPPAVSVGIKLHVGLGQIDRAREEADLLRRIRPQAEERAKAGRSLFRRPEHREREIRFLRVALTAP